MPNTLPSHRLLHKQGDRLLTEEIHYIPVAEKVHCTLIGKRIHCILTKIVIAKKLRWILGHSKL